MLDGSSELIPVDEEADDQIVHLLRLREADRAAHSALDPRPPGDVLALDFLHVFFADHRLLFVDMPLVGSPAVRVIPSDAKRLQQGLQARHAGNEQRRNKEGCVPKTIGLTRHSSAHQIICISRNSSFRRPRE
jgi:hypothetical protein